MEFINEYIFITSNKTDSIAESSCIATKDDNFVYLTYLLSDNDCLFDFGRHKNSIEIKIQRNYFEKYDDNFEIVVEKQTICCNTQSKLFELINCKLTGLTRHIFMESLVLYLIYQVQKNNLLFHLNCDTCTFLNKPVEIEKIQKAKEFIHSNIDQNITIPTIASFVGTNQCYLKKSFKEVTGQTIFEFIQDNRMVKAKHLLKNTTKPMSEIASEVGYASSSSFSQTYKNYFGISPSAEQKKIITNN